MKITFYTPINLKYGGGGEYSLMEMSEYLSQRGHNVTIFTLYPPSELSLNQIEIEKSIDYQSFPYLKFRRGTALPNPFALKKIIAQFNSSDIVYLPFSPPNELTFGMLRELRRIKTPIICGFRTFLRYAILLQRIYEYLIKYGLIFTDAFHTLNLNTERLLKNWGYSNVYYIPNAVHSDRFKLCLHPSYSNTFNVLYIGRLSEDKGVDVFVDVIEYINMSFKLSDIRFVVAGSGPYEWSVKRMAKRYNNFVYLGVIPHNSISQVYRKGHILVALSRVEGMPRNVLEAFSCGLPVVGSNIPGIADLIIQGENGVLLRSRNVKAIAEVIMRYYSLWKERPEEYYEMNKRIRSMTVEKYDWDRTMKLFEAMLRNVASERYPTPYNELR